MNIKFHTTGKIVRLKYIHPVIVNREQLASNDFYKITITSNQNITKDFYLSVLPGLHQLELNELIFNVESFFHLHQFSFDHINLSQPFFNTTIAPTHNMPTGTSLFYIESIIFSFLKNELPSFCHKPKDLLLSELYLTEHLERYKQAQSIKIKISPKKDSWEKLLVQLKELHLSNPNINFRLDGNRQFEIETLNELITIFPQELLTKIDYIEEPFKNFYDSFLFNKYMNIPIALDESYKNYIDYPENYPNDWPSIIKPSLFGISKIYQWLASNQKKRFILSSSYEDASVLEASYFLATFNPLESHGLALYVKNPDQKIPHL